MGHIFLHTQFGSTKIALLKFDGIVVSTHLHLQVVHRLGQVETETDTGVFHKRFLIGIEAGLFLHELGMLIEIVGISLTVASEFLVDGAIESGKIRRVFHLLTVVPKQGSQNLTVSCHIERFIIVLETDILPLAMTNGV